MPDTEVAAENADDEQLAMLESNIRGLHADIDDIDKQLRAFDTRISALEPPTIHTNDGTDAWTYTATRPEWEALAAWVDWLSTDYALSGQNRISPCWPAHPAACEQLAALWHAWLAARAAQARDVGEAMVAWHERWLWNVLPHVHDCFTSCSTEHQARPIPPLTEVSLLPGRGG